MWALIRLFKERGKDANPRKGIATSHSSFLPYFVESTSGKDANPRKGIATFICLRTRSGDLPSGGKDANPRKGIATSSMDMLSGTCNDHVEKMLILERGLRRFCLPLYTMSRLCSGKDANPRKGIATWVDQTVRCVRLEGEWKRC